MGTTGHYFGYKRSGAMYVDDRGTPDRSEFYNISKDEMLGIGNLGKNPSPQPEVVTQAKGEVQAFMRQCHAVVSVLVGVLGRELGLAPGLLEGLHRIERPSVCQARVTHAPPVKQETICLGEHTDFGSVTVLFNQLGGLQVLAPGGGGEDWQYVAPRPECAVINLGDALVKLVGGRLYSAVHRVMGPPGEQAQSRRYSVVYFARPNSEVLLRDLFEDPEGVGEGLVNADEWVKRRAKTWNTANYRGKESYKESRGTEHNAGVGVHGEERVEGLDKPRGEAVEAI